MKLQTFASNENAFLQLLVNQPLKLRSFDKDSRTIESSLSPENFKKPLYESLSVTQLLILLN